MKLSASLQILNEVKTCTKCREGKPPTEFTRDRRKPDGLMAQCKTCRSKALREWVRNNPNYEKNRYRQNPQWHRERHLIRKYGVNLAEYHRLFETQDGRCAICGRTQQRAFDVDHCHKTKAVRGLLCTNCNRMIGHSGDDPDRLESAARYLRSSRRSRMRSSRESRK